MIIILAVVKFCQFRKTIICASNAILLVFAVGETQTEIETREFDDKTKSK